MELIKVLIKKRTMNPAANKKKINAKANSVLRKKIVKIKSKQRQSKSQSKPIDKPIVNETIHAIKQENIFLNSSAKESNMLLALLEKERAFLNKAIYDLKVKLNESNIKISNLSEEIIKRNNNLKILSDAYVDLKSKYEGNIQDIEKFRSDRHVKENVIQMLKEDLDKKRKETIRNNLHIEALYKQLTGTDLKAREIALLNNKLQARCDDLIEELKKKDIETIKKQKDMNILLTHEQKDLKMQLEQKQAMVWQKEQFLKKKIMYLVAQLKEKDKIIEHNNKEFTRIARGYKHIKDFFSELRIPNAPKLKIHIPAPPRPRHPAFKQKKEINGHYEIKEQPEIKEEYQKAGVEKQAIKQIPTQITEEIPEEIMPELLPEQLQQYEEDLGDEVFGEPEPLLIKEAEEDIEQYLPYAAEEIVSMVKVAEEHGDSLETIKNSLVNSRYNPAEVDKAIEKVKEIKR